MRRVLEKVLTLVALSGVLVGLGDVSIALAEQGKISYRNWSYREIGGVPTQSGGRVKPLDSFAREVVLFVSGSRAIDGQPPIETLLSWMSYPREWEEVPIISVRDADLRKQLLLDPKRQKFSIRELFSNSTFLQYARSAQDQTQSPAGVPLPAREQEQRRVFSRISTFQAIVTGDAWLLVPSPAPEAWLNLNSQEPRSKEIQKAFLGVVRSYFEGDREAFDRSVAGLKAQVESRISGDSGWRGRIQAEQLYHGLHPFRLAWMLYLLAMVFWIVALNLPESSRARSGVKLSALGVSVLGFGMHLFAFGLRIYIAGRPPVSNMYESVVWVALGIVVFGYVIYWIYKNGIILAAALGLATFGLIVADAAPAMMDPSIQPLVPVLRSNLWLIVHVLTITLGYAAYALALAISNVTMYRFLVDPATAQPSAHPLIRQLNLYTYRATQFGTVLLAAGTILGGVWADYSWGRFWGWDPKETWALIALLGYLVILHGRFAGYLRDFSFPAWNIVAFLLVVMAWYGVNFVLGVGLHSYGFSQGGLPWVSVFCSLQVLYVVAAAWVYRKRREKIASA